MKEVNAEVRRLQHNETLEGLSDYGVLEELENELVSALSKEIDNQIITQIFALRDKHIDKIKKIIEMCQKR